MKLIIIPMILTNLQMHTHTCVSVCVCVCVCESVCVSVFVFVRTRTRFTEQEVSLFKLRRKNDTLSRKTLKYIKMIDF